MTEAYAEHPDYFSENAALLDTINNRILDQISNNPRAAIAFDLQENTSDIIVNHEALPIHHARMAVRRLVRLAAPFQQPIGSIFAQACPFDTPNLNLELTVLTNANEEPFALRSVTTQEDGDILDITAITHINGICTEAHRHISPRNTELTNLITSSIADHAMQMELISLLRYHTADYKIDESLAEILDKGWFTPASTIESHLARLLRNHIASEQEARHFAVQLDMDKPSTVDLRQIIGRLH